MKKFIILIYLSITVFANNKQYELKLYEKVLGSLFEQKRINVYVDDTLKEILMKSENFIIVNKCSDALVQVGDNFELKCENLPYFATSYKTFKNETDVIGAFYWRKGRPQLKLKTKVIDKFNLKLPKTLEKYAK